MDEYEGYPALLETEDDLVSGRLTWQHVEHMGELVFVEDESDQVYLPNHKHALRISDVDRLRAAAVAERAKQMGWHVEWESPWDYTGRGSDER